MNMDERMKQRGQVSALVDGQLDGAELDAALQEAAGDEDALATWHVYHVVGDVLRSRDLGACGHDRAFVARLSARLQAESATLSRSPRWVDTSELIAGEDRITLANPEIDPEKSRVAANDSSFRWKLVAGFASLAAVMAVGWNAVGFLGGAAPEARLAQVPSVPAVVEASAGAPGPMVMVRDPRLDELLAAHRQFGGLSALQNPSGFLRNATFEGAAR